MQQDLKSQNQTNDASKRSALKKHKIPQFEQKNDIICVSKAIGMRTHKVSEDQLGLVEVLSSYIDQELKVVHRLDKETSGLILFARNPTTAARIAHEFENNRVEKKYLFLSAKKNQNDFFCMESHIEKNEHQFINNPNKENNSKTKFVYLEKVNNYYLYQAEPISGKSHQIRLHAELAGIPILGDLEHNGNSWFRLALHSSEISFYLENEHYQFKIPTPHSFYSNESELILLFENAWQSLNSIYQIENDSCYRLIHTSRFKLQADIYGSVLWVYWYENQPITDSQFSDLLDFAKSIHRHLIVRHMINRGHGVGLVEQQMIQASDGTPQNWIATENGIQYQLKQNSGFSPGLFLDQCDNRFWVYQNSKNKTVLNLFSYTSGFSVAATAGEAEQVTSVDASTSFLEWSKENYKINGLNPELAEFFNQDSLLFLNGAKKRNRKWDLIICDPPSFGRTKTTTWKIEKDLPELALLLSECLSVKGQILFTCNYEKWNVSELEQNFFKKVDRRKYKIQSLPTTGLDFDFPDAYQNLTKGFIVNCC